MSIGPRFDDMPPDPDEDDVPAGLTGQSVQITEPDGTTTTATLVIVPGLFGHARRLREGFYNQPNGDTE